MKIHDNIEDDNSQELQKIKEIIDKIDRRTLISSVIIYSTIIYFIYWGMNHAFNR